MHHLPLFLRLCFDRLRRLRQFHRFLPYFLWPVRTTGDSYIPGTFRRFADILRYNHTLGDLGFHPLLRRELYLHLSGHQVTPYRAHRSRPPLAAKCKPSDRLGDVEVVYPCVDMDESLLPVKTDEDPLWNGQKRLLSINRFERKKDMALAIRAYHGLGAEKRKGTRLVIAGKLLESFI